MRGFYIFPNLRVYSDNMATKEIPKTINGISQSQIDIALGTLEKRLAKTSGSDTEIVSDAVRYTKLALVAGVDKSALSSVWAKEVIRCMRLDQDGATDMAERRTNAAGKLGFDISNEVIIRTSASLRKDIYESEG